MVYESLYDKARRKLKEKINTASDTTLAKELQQEAADFGTSRRKRVAPVDMAQSHTPVTEQNLAITPEQETRSPGFGTIKSREPTLTESMEDVFRSPVDPAGRRPVTQQEEGGFGTRRSEGFELGDLGQMGLGEIIRKGIEYKVHRGTQREKQAEREFGLEQEKARESARETQASIRQREAETGKIRQQQEDEKRVRLLRQQFATEQDPDKKAAIGEELGSYLDPSKNTKVIMQNIYDDHGLISGEQPVSVNLTTGEARQITFGEEPESGFGTQRGQKQEAQSKFSEEEIGFHEKVLGGMDPATRKQELLKMKTANPELYNLLLQRAKGA